MIAEDVKAKNFEQPEPVNVEEALNRWRNKCALYSKQDTCLTVLILLSILSLYGLVLFVGYFYPTHFRFRSSKKPLISNTLLQKYLEPISKHPRKSRIALKAGVIELQTPDNVTLQLLIHANDELRQRDGQVPDTILYLHGKDGWIDRRTTMISEIYTKHYCKYFYVFLLRIR